MLSIPSEFINQFVHQGINKGLISNVQRTLNGESFLHDSFIEQVISKEAQDKGKMSVDKLAEILSVEQSVITKALVRFKENVDYQLVDDLILTRKFVDDSFTDLKEQINKSGFISIVGQTGRLGLPYVFLKELLLSLNEDDNYTQVRNIPDIIWTSEFIDSCKTRILRSLKESYDPVQMFKVQKELNIQEDLFYVLLEDIMKESDSLGTLRGRKGRALFEPYLYRLRQFDMIKSLYHSTGYLSYDTVKEIYNLIPVEDVVKQVLSGDETDDIYLLGTCAISSIIMDDTINIINSAEKLLCLKDVLPTVLTKTDINQVIDIAVKKLRKDKKVIVLDDGYITTPETVQYIVDKSKDDISNYAIKLKQQNKYEKASLLSDVTITKLIADNTEFKSDKAKLFTPFTTKQMNKIFTESIKTPYLPELKLNADPWVKEQREKEYRLLVNQRRTIYFNYQSIQLFKDEISRKKLERYVLKTQTIDFIYHLILYLILEQSFNQKEVDESISLTISANDIEQQTTMDDKTQRSAIDYFLKVENHQIDKTQATQMIQFIEKKNLKAIIVLLRGENDIFKSEVALDSPTAQIQCRDMTHTLLDSQLKSVTVGWSSAPATLHLTSLLLFLNIHKTPLYVSGKFVPAIIDQISPSLNHDHRSIIFELQNSILGKTSQASVGQIKAVQDLGLDCTFA